VGIEDGLDEQAKVAVLRCEKGVVYSYLPQELSLKAYPEADVGSWHPALKVVSTFLTCTRSSWPSAHGAPESSCLCA